MDEIQLKGARKSTIIEANSLLYVRPLYTAVGNLHSSIALYRTLGNGCAFLFERIKMQDDSYYMTLAFKEAKLAAAEDEVPVGAVLVSADGEVLAATHNTSEHGLHAMAHAETVAMSIGAITLEQKRLWDCTLYVTLEPCTMCAAALSMMRIKRLVYGAANPKGGAVENGVKFFESPACNHKPEIVSGVMAEECGALLSAFFKKKRV